MIRTSALPLMDDSQSVGCYFGWEEHLFPGAANVKRQLVSPVVSLSIKH